MNNKPIRSFIAYPFYVLGGVFLFVAYLITADSLKQSYFQWLKKYILKDS